MKQLNNLFLKLFCIIMALVLIPGGLTSVANASALSQTGTQPEYIEKVLNSDNVTQINIEIKDADWDLLIENASKKEYRSCTITINGETFYNVGIKPKGNSSMTMVASSGSPERYSFKLDFGEYVDGQTCFGLEKISLNNMFSDKTYMKEYLSYELFDYMGVPSPACAFTHISINGEEWGLYLAVEGVEESFLERQFDTSAGNLYKPETMDMGGEDGGMPGFMDRGRNNENNMPDGVMPKEGMPQGGMPEGGMPEGDLPQGGLPQGGAPEGDFPQGGLPQGGMPETNEAEGNNMGQGRIFGGGMPGGSRESRGADLKYTSDSASEYSAIRDNAVLKTTTDKEFEKVIEMIKNLNSGTNLTKYLDVDEILRYFAVNTFLVNLDSYAGGMYHNYYLYEKDGVFKILPWDLNMSFAGMSVNSASSAVNFPIDNPVTTSLENTPLIGKLLEVPEYKELYHKYLYEIANSYVGSGMYEASISRVYTLINNYVKNDATSFYSYEDFKNSIPALATFGKDRAASINAQLLGEQPSTEYGNLATTLDLSLLGSMNMGRGMGDRGMQGGNNNNGQAMPDFRNIQSAMSIINEAGGKELTAEQKDKLKELGFDENMIDMIKNMGAGQGGFPGGNNMGRMPGFGNRAGDAGSSSLMQTVILAVSALCLIGGLMFVFRFKRKKYRSA